MNDRENQLQYFRDVILFFNEVKWLYNMPVTRILCKGSLDLFPAEWLEALKLLENSELNNFVVKGNIQVCANFF